VTSGIVDRLGGTRVVHVDTCALIYVLEQRAPWDALMRSVLVEFESGRLGGTSSVLTLLEVLVQPLKEGRRDLADRYRQILTTSRAFELLQVDSAIAESAARIRARYNFRSPDAIQFASALRAGAGAFITNDKDLRRFTELDVLILDDFTGAVAS
jgi:predicted nucleic acid-binding protein